MKHNPKYRPQRITFLLACVALPVTALASDLGSVLPNGNTADGEGVLFNRTTGTANSGFGFQSLFHDTTGSYNTATGYRALFNDTTGHSNTADGFEALYSDTNGIRNTAMGAGALLHNNGSYNTATGWAALVNNTSASANTADGAQALYFDTTGTQNTAVGAGALLHNNGSANTAVGWAALTKNTTANFNTALGWRALSFNTTGQHNTAVGYAALISTTAQSENTAIGFSTLFNTTTGTDNTALGHSAGRDQTSGSGNVYLGSNVFGSAAEANKTRIRNIGITPILAGATVVIAAAGSGIGDEYLGYSSSSRRYKQDIQPIAKGSQALFSLKPVTYRASSKAAPTDVKLYGLVAEDVADVDRNLVIFNQDGRAEAVRYDSVNAMLLNEFLKEHRTVEELKKQLADLTAIVRQQAEQIQKVNARLESSESNRQIASNNHRRTN
jgi:Chaperone of endosialidase